MEKEKLWCQLYPTSLEIQDVTRFLYDSRVGGVNIFVGTTREWTGDKQTTSLSYEAYEPMAIKEMKALLEEALEKWPVVRACILHRTGLVPAAHPSVIIGVATPHRKDAFEACRFLIDSLKTRCQSGKRKPILMVVKSGWILLKAQKLYLKLLKR